MKNKRHFLLGIGTGLILASLCMIVFNTIDFSGPSGKDFSKGENEPYLSSKAPEPQKERGQSERENNPNREDAEIYKEIIIRSGMTADEIASLLAKEGIIKDEISFVNLLQERGVVYRLKAGTYLFGSNWENEKVLETLLKDD
ncbi:MAG: hypothetical protein ACOX7U_07360 [Desulfitobacteriia bacterium]